MITIDLENHFAATGWLAAVRKNDIQLPASSLAMFDPASPMSARSRPIWGRVEELERWMRPA